MLRTILTAIFIASFAIHSTADPPDTGKSLAAMQGVCFVAPQDELKSNPFEPVKELGANYVAVIPYAFCRQNEPAVNYDYPRQWWGETAEGARKTIEYAQEKGLKVMLKPHLWVGGEGWPGGLTFEKANQWETWHTTYTDYILHFARIAEEMNVEVLTIGTECKQLVRKRPEFWRSLIDQVRDVYQGKVTYQANWDNFKHVSFWDQLDFISISGYFPLTEKNNSSDKAIAKAWQEKLKTIERMNLAYQKPVIFGEFGYASKEGALRKPWQGGRNHSAPTDLTVQKQGYAMLFREVWPQKWFRGGFLWKWYANHEKAGGPGNNRFTPQNKPAEEVIRDFYQK